MLFCCRWAQQLAGMDPPTPLPHRGLLLSSLQLGDTVKERIERLLQEKPAAQFLAELQKWAAWR